MPLATLLLALFSLPLLAAGPADDLLELSSVDARTRELATRRLCAELRPEQELALIALAGEADFELERRITRILAARDERLPLILELFGDKSSHSRLIARAAFVELLSRWNPSYATEAISGERLKSLLYHSQRGLVHLPASVGKPAALFERLAQGARLGLPLVIDRGVDLIPSRSTSSLQGAPLELLDELCAQNKLSYQLHGVPVDASGLGQSAGQSTGQWIRVSAARDAGLSSSDELLLLWALRVRAGASDALASARALANTGWPAPLLWFEERWRERGDRAALSGLLTAASKGRCALVLTELDTQIAIRERLDELAEGEVDQQAMAEIEEIARGIARVASRSATGEDLSEVWQSASRETPRLGLWARLVVLEGQRSGACELTKRVLSEGVSRDPELWFRALRALVADLQGSSDLDWTELEFPLDELVGLATRPGLGRALHQLGMESGALSACAGLELLRAELALREGKGCGELLHSAWIESGRGTALEPLLVRWRVEFGRSRVALALRDLELSEEVAEGWERLLELSGVLRPGSTGDAGDDLQRLACRAGGAGGAELRGLLLEELSMVDPSASEELEELWMAWRRVAWALQETGQEEALRSFAIQTAAEAVENELLRELLRDFPPAPRGLHKALDVGLLRR